MAETMTASPPAERAAAAGRRADRRERTW